MRFLILQCTFFAALNAAVSTPAPALWNDLQAKRGKLSSFHQEFDVSHTSKNSQHSQSSKRQVVVDASPTQWREKSIAGSGTEIIIFDGKDLFSMEEGGDEYVRNKRNSKDEDPVPSPYRASDADWSKAVEVERKPCALPGMDHQCVVIDVPMKPWTKQSGPNKRTKLLSGAERMVIDIETGLLITSKTLDSIEGTNGSYLSETTYSLKRMRFGGPADETLFKLPSEDMREVKEISSWNAAKIKKQLAGKPAPEISVNDIHGKPVSLSALKGKTVLLDFFTTWCGPCRADGPALDKLYGKYGDQDLMIVGISVDEDRAIVEKFLTEHQHKYPVVLSSENEMPRPYQIRVFPTYIVIGRDGTVASAMEGDQGFGDLRKHLKKAGLEAE